MALEDSVESEILEFGNSVEYAWDDLNLPHKLVVQINETHLLREINIDKVCSWKPFIKTRQTRGLALHLSFDKKSGDKRGMNFDESHGLEMLKVGYEVYTDASTRVLRICEFADNRKEVKVMQPCMKIQFRVSSFAIHLLEKGKQDVDRSEASIYSTIMVARLGNITLDSIFTDQYKFNQIRVQTLYVDEKWEGAPFAAMIRRNRLDYNDMNDNVLFIVFNLRSTVSNVKEVQYSSIVLQPIDLNLDEETLMRLVPFWRTSLNNSNTQSQQYYFKHFEIHPIKIVASFLPGTPSSSYSSAQETLRSLLHNVIKIPTVKKMVVELNGVLLTHALVTTRELVIKCAQHYSWYAMRAIYIAKGSPLLPPAFASIFDDSASSSLDVFFDPSSGVVNLPGLTLGMFKFVSKCINTKGFSGTKRYFGDLGKTIKIAGSNVLFAAITEISDSIVRGAETSGFNGMVNGFHQGILKLAMEPALLGTAVMEGGPDRKIKLDRSPEVDELYIEGYLQAMLDVMYKQEYLRVRVIDDQVLLKNLPPNSSLIEEIVENVKSFLVSKALLKGDSSLASHPLHHLRGESEWKIGPTVLTLCEHLFVSFAIRILRKQAGKLTAGTIFQSPMAVSNSPEQTLAPKPDPFSRSDLRRRPSAKTAIPTDLSAIPDSSSNDNASLSPGISRDVSTESSIADASSGVDERDPIPNHAQEANGDGERIANGEDRVRDADVPVRFTYRPSVPAHLRVRESPLSSDAIFKQSHAGLFNLCIVVLVAVNSRLIIENLMKYGLLIRAGFWFSSKSLRDWPLFMCCLSLSIFSLLAFVVEKMAQHKFISEPVVIFLHTVITTSEILYPIFMILRYDSAVQSGLTLMFVTCIVWLKLVSYAHTNYDLRALNKSTDKGDAAFSSQNPDNSHNVNIKSLAYFMVAPTLCYQPSYPRTTCIRKGWVIRQVVKLVIFTGVMGFIIEQYINPIVKNSKHPLKGDFLNAVERVLKLSVPTLYVWLCMFYCFFHLWLNILAELLCFGDREFYKDWWNAKTIEEYWRMWNMPVHKWMVRHIYFPCLRNGIPKGVAVVIAFFFSAVFHELCVGIPCHIFKLWAFIGIMLQVPLVILTNYLQNKFKNTMVGNMVFWFFFSILGQPMCVLLYYHDLMNRSKVRTS